MSCTADVCPSRCERKNTSDYEFCRGTMPPFCHFYYTGQLGSCYVSTRRTLLDRRSVPRPSQTPCCSTADRRMFTPTRMGLKRWPPPATSLTLIRCAAKMHATTKSSQAASLSDSAHSCLVAEAARDSFSLQQGCSQLFRDSRVGLRNAVVSSLRETRSMTHLEIAPGCRH